MTLLAALCAKDAQAAAAWQAWRSSLDIEHVTWPDMQILPLLNGPRLEAWLANDPDAGILRGIVRRAWSEAQVRLGTAREVTECLQRAGCETTQVGALGAYLRSLSSAAIRPVLELRMLIARDHLPQAAAALEAEGWQLRDQLPTGVWLERMTHLFFMRNGTRLLLYWRLLSVEGRRSLACEREFLSTHCVVEAAGTPFRILAPEHALLEALTDPEESVDALAWQADAALILLGLDRRDETVREAGAAVSGAFDWRRWAKIAARYRPEAFERLGALRMMGLAVPALRAPARIAQWALYREAADLWRRAAAGWTRRFSAAAEKR